MSPEDYVDFPSKQKSVKPETYQVVFERVWKRYDEFQKATGCWDHQDLARFVLEEDLVKNDFPVVFCDEAQDFTRIELEVLHRLSLFHKRSLQNHEVPRVPIAFAGDPFQTLNPTGFRWEATKAFFTEKFIESFPGAKRDLNYRELTYNYRSSPHSVRFNNSLQLLRSSVCGFTEIAPQKPWEDAEDTHLKVPYFNRNEPEVLESLQNQSEIRILVPCEEGGEAKWLKDQGLSDYVAFDDTGVPKNVVSPTRVKVWSSLVWCCWVSRGLSAESS